MRKAGWIAGHALLAVVLLVLAFALGFAVIGYMEAHPPIEWHL